ncbi:MAG: response regulator transcription factor [Ardenticatenaceae bacterium]|nr:response regulator transcription factor [Ardenticatenaceae bacterium]
MTKQHILIIEDDTAVAQSLQDGLQQAGYATTWHHHGQAGITFARQQHPHLILLDVRLPDGSGFDFCRQMRQLKLRQPIIMLTVQGEEMDKVLGLEMGADDYLTKPYSLRELLSRIRAHLRRAYGELSAADADHLFVRDLVIDLGRGKVERGAESIALTPTEFRLLVFLARHSGQALSRSQILQAVWEDDLGVESERTVNVHIRRLREKVELDPSRPTLILTVPGIGYRLAAD